MSIPNRIRKAESDLAAHDFENALLQALIAVAATSRKRYPKAKDREAFEKFLRNEFGAKIQPNISIHGGYISVAFNGEQQRLEHILYRYVRCNLVHEGSLPPQITFVVREGFYVSAQNSLEIGYGVIEILIRIVKEAPENAGMFPAPPMSGAGVA